MNLRQLRTFVAVADAGSFARALGRLHLSQPAASRQIAGLEAELGVLLFDRSGRGIRLTPQGEDLLRQSRLVLTDADSLRERARALKQGDAGILRLGATPQVIENLLAAFLTSYRRSHPGIEVRLVEDGGARLPDRLAEGEVDVAIMPSGDERFGGRLLYPMHVFAVLPKAHRLAHRAMLEVSELANDPLLVLGRGFASRGVVRSRLPRRPCQTAHRPRKRRTAHGDRAGERGTRDRGGSIGRIDSREDGSCPTAGSSRDIDREVGHGGLGRAALPASVCRALCA